MESVEKSVVVKAGTAAAYQLWTNFENFPRFMTSVREVRRIDESRYHIRSERGGKEYEITVEMTLQIPERRVAWRTTSGEESSGVVSFEPEPDGNTRVRFKMKFDPNAGWKDPAVLSERLQSHLENFKKLIETGSC